MFKSHDPFSLKGILALAVLFVAAIGLLKLVSIFLSETDRPAPPPATALYRDSSEDPEDRISDLLGYMTLEEKVAQMALIEKNSIKDLADVGRYGLGGILSGGGAKPDPNTKEGWRDLALSLDTISRSSRLGIPVLYGVDANHGHGNVPGATIFPHAIGLGATEDEDLVFAIARATSEELRATGIRWNFAPSLDLPQDSRWGRVYEAFGDDPELAGRLGAAYVRGLQSGAGAPDVLATPKHYVGAGAMRWASSKSDTYLIDQGVTPADLNALRREYLPPFQAAVEAGAQVVMVGLNSWGDTLLSAHTYLVSEVLKGELGFEGFAVSDWYGVYEVPGGDYRAAVIAINAGIDMVMLPFEYRPFIENVSRAVRAGDISEARINDAVRRILRAKFALGLFDEPVVKGDLDTVGSTVHRALAREAVARSLVLLKDNSNALPLQGDGLIRVAGSAADNTGKQAGGWTIEWQGVDGNVIPGATSILEGFKAAVGDDGSIEFDAAGNFDVEKIAKVGIAVVGESPYAEGWGDTPEPRISAEDLEAIERLHAASERVVVVLVTGRPLILPESWQQWDALVVAWLPGSEGAGVADVLFGSTPFAGTLPIPWPQSIAQLPIAADQSTADGTALLFPRYFGLE